MDTTTPTLAVDPDEPLGPPPDETPPTRRARWPWVLAGLAVLFGVASLVAAVVELPYYVISAGSARPTEPTVVVSGAESFPAGEDILFTTVSLSQRRINGWEWLQAELDDEIDLIGAETIEGGNTAEENQVINQELMDQSQDVAIVVALEHLGFQVIEGTGATVTEILPQAPVEGIIDPGDTIVRADGERVERNDDVVAQIVERSPGDTLDLVIEPERGPRRREQVTLGSFTDRQDAPCLVSADEVEGEVTMTNQTCMGVRGLITRDEERNFPFDVSIDPGQVRGPSAGLAFTLAVLDVLTPGDLTGGHPVAVTGTIDGLGNVGLIGGAEYKAIAAREAGVELFLVPAGEEDIAASRVGDDVTIVPVASLDDALEALAEIGGNALDLETPVPSAG